jgi:hypothetical protein
VDPVPDPLLLIITAICKPRTLTTKPQRRSFRHPVNPNMMFGFVRDEHCHRTVSMVRVRIFWELVRETKGMFN